MFGTVPVTFLHQHAVDPYAAAIEAMASTRLPVLANAPTTPAASAPAALWTDVDRVLTRLG
jgi:hypothetical protein